MKQNKYFFRIIILLFIVQITESSHSGEAIETPTFDSNPHELFEKYNYDPTGRRDPFKAFKSNINQKLSLISPLEKWDLDEFSVVGILWGGKEPRAMLKDPEGQMVTVNKKSKIGKNNGQVVKIREGQIVVVETIQHDGEIRHETRTLEIKK